MHVLDIMISTLGGGVLGIHMANMFVLKSTFMKFATMSLKGNFWAYSQPWTGLPLWDISK